MSFLGGLDFSTVDVAEDPLFGGLVVEEQTNPAGVLFRRCVAAAVKVHARGELPSGALLARTDRSIPLEQANLVVRSVRFREAMRESGVELDQTALTPEQQAFLATFFAPEMWQRPQQTRLRAAGVSQRQFTGWVKQPLFALEFERWQEDVFAGARASAQTALQAAVDEGKAWAVKLTLAKTHFYDPQGEAAEMHRLLSALYGILDDELRGPQHAGTMKRIGDRVRAVMPDLVAGTSDRRQVVQEPLVLEPAVEVPVPPLSEFLDDEPEPDAPAPGPGASLSGEWVVDLSQPVRLPPRP